MNRLLASLLIVAVANGPALGDDTAPELTVNPFERPGWLGNAREVAEPARPARVRLELRATLSGNPSLANVGGRIVTPGEQVEGYTLVSVGEGTAEFRNGETTIMLRVAPEKREGADD